MRWGLLMVLAACSSAGNGSGDAGDDAAAGAGTGTGATTGGTAAQAGTSGATTGGAGAGGDAGSGGTGGSSASADPLGPACPGAPSCRGEWQTLAASYHHTCAIHAGGLYCWGEEGFWSGAAGEYNDGLPQRLGDADDWTAVAGGGGASCAIRAGALYCWGTNAQGHLANGTVSTTEVPQPQQVGSATDWNAIAVRSDFASNVVCGLRGGELYCWGHNGNWQLGDPSAGGDACADGNESCELAPLRVGSESDWDAIAVGRDATCALRGGELYCWGLATKGLIPDSIAVDDECHPLYPCSTTPAPVGARFDAVDVGGEHACGIRDGALYCWGSNAEGQLGLGALELEGCDTPPCSTEVPARVGDRDDWGHITAGRYHSCGIAGGELYCWGFNRTAQTAQPELDAPVLAPARVGNDSDWNLVDAGPEHTCGIRAGEVYCWGYNGVGEVGDGVVSDETCSGGYECHRNPFRVAVPE